MDTIIRALGPLVAVALAGSALLAETAPTAHSNRTAPISAELARTCRALAIKAHPTQPAGSRTASGQAQSRATYNAGDRFIPHLSRATATILVGGRRALRPGILLEHLEGPDAAASRDVGEIGIAGAHHVRPGGATGDGDVLLAVELPGDRLSDDAGGGLEFPQNL